MPTKNFTQKDIVDGQFPRIYVDYHKDLVQCPLPWQKMGLQQTASGYGAKLTNTSKIMFEGKLYRIYTTIYSNNGSSWFKAKGRKIYVN